MKQRHPNCELRRCSICMSDHIAVGEELERLTGDSRTDHLGKFALWLDNNGLISETEFGWATKSFFDNTLMARYVESRK